MRSDCPGLGLVQMLNNSLAAGSKTAASGGFCLCRHRQEMAWSLAPVWDPGHPWGQRVIRLGET